MGVFDNTKCVNKEGTKRAVTDVDVVDMYGTIKGSPQFETCKIVDIYGDLGCAPLTGPWEAQNVTTGETVGTHLSHIATAYNSTSANPLTNFASAGITGYMDGVISGTGPWTIQSGTQTIGGVPWAGTGLIISTANNTITGMTTLQAGARLQLGADVNSTTGRTGSVTLNTGAILDVFGANGPTAATKLGAITNNGGTINAKGPGICGQGYFTGGATFTNVGTFNIDDCEWRLLAQVSGTGTINIEDGGTLNNGGQNMGSNQTVNINGCGWCNGSGVQEGVLKFEGSGVTWGANTKVQSPSCFMSNSNANTTFSGLLSGSEELTVGSLAATKPNGVINFTNTANTYNGRINVDDTTIGGSAGTALQYAQINLINGGRLSTNTSSSCTIGSLMSNDASTYWAIGGFSNVIIKNNGITEFDGRLLGTSPSNLFLEGGSSNELTLTNTGNTININPRGGARLILQGAQFTSGAGMGQARVTTGATISAGTSTTALVQYLAIDATSKLEVRAVGAGASLLNVGANGFVPTAGWKVDLPDAMAAGTYDIVSYLGAATTVLPTIGINNSGRSVSFVYANGTNPKKLRMILV